MRIKSLLKAFSFCSFLAFVACQTSPKTQLERLDSVQVGMDKAQVLDTIGAGPRKSERKSGQDRWIYEVFPDREGSITEQREIRFENGKVVYRGAVQKPAISAAEQDRLNATAKTDNMNIDSELKRESRKQSVDLKEEIAKDMPAKAKFEEITPADEAAAQQ